MFRTLTIVIVLIAILPRVYGETLLGFDEVASEKQRAIESEFDKGINAKEQDAWLKKFSAKPHHAGSKASKEVAHAIAELFASWGYDTRIEEYEILLPTPKHRSLELTAPTSYRAALVEDSLDGSCQIRARCLQPLGERIEEALVGIEPLIATLTRYRLEATDSGGDAALGDNLEKADVAGPARVGPAAELRANAGHGNYTYFLLIFLSKESDGPRVDCCVQVHDFGPDHMVFKDDPVDAFLDVLNLSLIERGVVRVIEA